MLRKLLTIATVCLISAGVSFAQSGSLSGTVTDANSGETLVGANVFISQISKGASTDANGQFEITDIPQGTYEVRISYIGYSEQSQSVDVASGDNTLDVSLESGVALDEVVVTALGVQREKRSLGYSVQEVQGDELSQTKETNFVTSLSGKVAGANISNSNSLGGSSRIVLRGASSITGDNQPLFVIDGVPLDNSNFTSSGQTSGGGGFDFGNAASVIDPNNIQSVSVLKSASATALYGSRGANGVIQITTKDGSASKGIGVSINSGVQFKQVYGLPNYQNEFGGGANAPFQQVDGQLFADYATDESWGPRLDGRPVRQWYSFDNVNELEGQETPWVSNPNNVKDFFNTGVTYNNNVSISHGGDDYSYQLSLTRLDQDDVFPNGSLDRKQVGFNGQAGLATDLNVAISANYVYEDVTGRPGTGYSGVNVFQQFSQFGQRQVGLGSGSFMSDFTRPDGTQRGWNWKGIDGARNGVFNFSNNPYWVRNKNYEEDDTQRLFGNVELTYNLSDNYNIKGSVRSDFYTSRRGTRFSIDSQEVPQFEEGIREVQETSARLTFNFNQSLSESITLDGLIGTNVRYNNYSRNQGTTQGGLSVPNVFTVENSISRPLIDDYSQEKQVRSVLASANLGYNDMLYLDVSARNDWSSSLPEDENSYLYYGATGSLIFTELAGIQSSNAFSFGKLFASYSKVGNDTDPYRLATTFPITLPFGSSPQLSVSNRLNNSNLKPEQSYEWEVGTQLEFFNNRGGLEVAYYNRRTEDQIIPVQVSRASGYNEQIINAGEVTNRGLEVELSATPLQLNNGLRWTISANWAKNVSKVEKLVDGLDNLTLGNAPFGVAINARVGEAYGTLVGTDFQYDDNGNKIVNSNGTYAVDNSQQVLGSYVPDWSSGVSTSVFFKGFSASVSLDGQKGGDIYSITNMFGNYSGILEASAQGDIREAGLIAEGVQEDGSTNTVRADAENFFKSLFGVKAAHIYDASYIKLREVRLAYSVPVSLFENTPLRGATISLVGRNLATLFKNTPNFDPTNVVSTSNVQGIEAGQIPPQRSYGFNIQLDL
jgi:TonB-linked SusC/RagA family outer membrane protein